MVLKFAKILIAGFVLFSLLAGVSFADEFHYNNFLIGDRAAGMGGAYTAVSDDPSGLYYNPAGIVYSTGNNLSASVNAFYSLDKKYKDVIGGEGWARHSSSLLPNFFGITQPLGKFKFGFSYAVPDSVNEDQNQVFNGNFATNIPGRTAKTYIINFKNEDNVYNFGPSLAYEITSNFSIGMTFYLHHRSKETIMNQFILMDDGTSEWTNDIVNVVERGYKPILGVMWSPADKWTVGISVAKTFVYGESFREQLLSKPSTTVPPNDVAASIKDTPGERKYPYEIRAGLAYFASSSLLVSADAAYYTKVTDPVFGDRVSVVNAAVGTEYYLNKNWAVRGGLFTNMASTPELQSTRTDQAEKIDYYGLSASISNFTRNTSITLGGNISTGSGQAQLLSNEADIQKVTSTGWVIFLSSSYSY